MKLILLTGSSKRHIAFANRIKMSKKINLLKIYYEEGNPLLKDVKKKENSTLLLRHLSERNQAEDDFFSWFMS